MPQYIRPRVDAKLQNCNEYMLYMLYLELHLKKSYFLGIIRFYNEWIIAKMLCVRPNVIMCNGASRIQDTRDDQRMHECLCVDILI